MPFAEDSMLIREKAFRECIIAANFAAGLVLGLFSTDVLVSPRGHVCFCKEGRRRMALFDSAEDAHVGIVEWVCVIRYHALCAASLNGEAR